MRIISGVQPSGTITLGNYLGAIQNFVKLQNENPDADILVFIADLHAITVSQDRLQLRQNILSVAAIYIACGLDPKKTHIFIQSEVPAHNQLGWVMECNSYIGELERMTQFKDKKVKQVQGVSAGLLTYPSLMAADILLYDTNLVPVGIDQKQHLELTRTLAERFNAKYGDTFVVPEPYIAPIGAKIMSLTDPLKKMSKSDENPKSYISLLDEPNIIRKKLKSAVTDSDTVISYDLEKKPGISNLLTIYSCLTNMAIPDIVSKYQNSSYAIFKDELAEIVVQKITEIQSRYYQLLHSDELNQILDEGRDYAHYISSKKIQKIYHKVGLGRKR